MTTLFISRHPGAIDWIKQQGVLIERWETHLSLSDVAPGDTVVGTLPIPMVAALNAIGAYYVHLNVEVPASLRGKELSLDDLNVLGATLQGFLVVPE
ncbi:CRISPR-associated protein [Arsukibacterium sp. MJ3]|uniref:CRISPR-associated protein Csx16 n=1 Tax=Arsukibacterium sp. MJ3 TaxID=1632859 RepID=UPI00062747FE|nr:CRISPR-associated protein Csx16 [Arsukibacterium sp. MJ3]KKO47662.1 CRISPR-associated protein [Arsukibacterium sp. MJ3]